MTDEHHHSDLPKHHRRESGRSPSRVEPNEVAERQVQRRKHRHHGHHRERREGTAEKEKTSSTAPTPIAARVKEEHEQVFFIDRKGDPQNVVYGGNQTSFTQRYHRWGYGNLIGVNRQYSISQDGSKAFDTGPFYDGRRRSHTNSLLTFRDNPKLGLEQVRAEVNEDKGDCIQLQRDFVMISSDKAKGRKRNASSGIVDSAMKVLTGPTTNGDEAPRGGSESDSKSDLDIAEENEEDAYEEFRNDTHRQRSLNLNRATLKYPQDVDTWLALIAHQDYVFGMDDHTSKEQLSAAAMHNLADIKLALYEKALTRVMDPEPRERLIEGLMDLGAVIWDVHALSRKWQAVLKANPSTSLWIRYVNFRQTTTTFSYEECLSILGNCLARACSETDPVNRDELSIYLLLRITALMLQCGHSERAIAVWQSVLEFTYFQPTHLDPSAEHCSFQAFWESEIPRVGEPGAAGWTLSKPFEMPSRSDPAPPVTSSNNVYESWALREIEVPMSSIMPARTFDDVAEDDPFRVVLYSDISEYLFRPSNACNHLLLINAFLKFCGLPALHYQGSVMLRKWWGDEFLSSSILSRDQPSSIEGAAVSDTKTLFPAETGLSIFSQTATEDSRNKATWQRTALRQLAAALVDDDALAEYVVAFEASVDVKEARRYAKSLLKSRPANLRLYNAYGLLECRLDRFECAEHVWSTAITMSHSASALEQQDIARVWSSWIFECLQRANLSRAKVLLSSIPDGQLATDTTDSFSNAAASQLRTKNYLKSHFSQHLSLRQEDGVLYFAELLAVFEYLTGSQSILAALAVYNSIFETLANTPASPSLIETLHQSRAHLLHIHPTLSPRGYRPAEINRELADSLRAFPSNSMFHHLYQEHTRRTSLLERIREVIPNRALAYGSNGHNTSVAPLLFAIQAEMSRPSYAGSTNHSIRAAFERAVTAAKACVRVWAWYIRWEASLDNECMPASNITSSRNKREIELRRNKAIDVYYRGIRACPWAKELYMLAFLEAPLRKATGDAELRRIYELMLEKGLRLHSEWNEGG